MPIIEEIIQNDSTVNNNNKLTSEEEQVLFDSLASKIANDPEAFKRLTSKVTSKDFNRIQVQPQAGFVCKTKVVKTRNKKYAVDTIVYINICYASAIPAPTIASEREIQKALNAEENTNYKVPVSMGEARMEQENTSLIMDACIHPEAYVRSEKDLDYRLYILELSMEYVEEILEVNLSREFTMPNTRSKGMIPSRLLKIPKPSLMQSILNELKKTIDNHQWKLEPEIKLEGKEERLKLIIPMPDNNKVLYEKFSHFVYIIFTFFAYRILPRGQLILQLTRSFYVLMKNLQWKYL